MGAIGLALGSTLLTLFAIEATLRWSAWRTEQRAVAMLANADPPAIPPGTKVELHQVLAPSRHHDRVFKLQKGLRQAVFCGGSFSTNNRGFRGPDVTESKPPETVRIVGIGDSVMFGWGVNDGDTYLSRLQVSLNALYPSRRWETVNTAVPGYSAHMEVATLEEAALDLRPDVVIYGYCINDLELPRFLQRRQDHLTLTRSYLVDFIRERRFRGRHSAGEDLVGLTRADRRLWNDCDPETVPPEYAHMVGLGALERALDRLEELSRTRAFRAVVLAHPPVLPEHDVLLRARFSVVYTEPLIERYLETHGIEKLEESPLIVGHACSGRSLDLHPSAEGHALILQALLDGVRWEALAEPQSLAPGSRR
ncbi:MAG: GDSL-type esterase/lipase family protein [Acidobacteriota bacterium]